MSKDRRKIGFLTGSLDFTEETTEFINLQLSEVEPDPNNFQKDNLLSEEDVERFAYDEILPVGHIITPITVRQLPNKRYMIISGERRWRAYKLLLEREKDEKWATIPAYILQVDDEIDHDIFGIIANYSQRNYSEYEKAMQAAKLLELYKKKGISVPESIKEVANNLNLSQSQIYRYTQFSDNVSEKLKEVVKDNKIGMTTAISLSKTDEETQQSILELVNSGIKLTKNDIDKFLTILQSENEPIDEIVEDTIKNNDDNIDDKIIDNSSDIPNNNNNISETQNPPEKVITVKDSEKLISKQLKVILKQAEKLTNLINELKNQNIPIDGDAKNKLKEYKILIMTHLNY
jgi:ParB family chromosome partitioning protein